MFTRSSAENDILFTNVNVEIHKSNLVVDSESVDAPRSPGELHVSLQFPFGGVSTVLPLPKAATCYFRIVRNPANSEPDSAH